MEIESVNQLIKRIHQYEFSLILIILDILKERIICDHFSKNDVQVWYCFIHDQGFLLSHPNHYSIGNIYTKTCNAYCHLDCMSAFDKGFLKTYSDSEVDFKLEWYMNSFYDYRTDSFTETPLALKLFYDKYK